MARYKLNQAAGKVHPGWNARLRKSENPRQEFQLAQFWTARELDGDGSTTPIKQNRPLMIRF